jgi:hypothetical protein
MCATPEYVAESGNDVLSFHVVQNVSSMWNQLSVLLELLVPEMKVDRKPISRSL